LGPTTLRPTTLTTLFPEDESVTTLFPEGEADEAEERWIFVPQTGRYTDLARKLRSSAGDGVQCIHDLTEDECAVCSGYVKWLIADESRLHRAQRDPEGVRREFWRDVRGEDG
jgi:hypothetical protein